MKSTLAIVLVAALAVAVYSQGFNSALNYNTTGSTCGSSCNNCVGGWSGINPVCWGCTGAFYFGAQSGACTACGSNCAACSSATNCLACNNGYYLASGACTACSATLNCGTCSTGTSCVTCAAGGPWLNTAGVCGSASLKFYRGVTTSTGATSVTAGSCTAADGNNMGLCVAGAVNAANAAGANTGSAFDYNTGALVTISTTSANTLFTASCLAYQSAANPGGAGLGFCVQCQQNLVPIIAGTAAAGGSYYIATCGSSGSTGWISQCVAYSIALNAASTALCAACANGYTPNTSGGACNACAAVTASCGAIPASAGYAWSTGTSAWVSCTGSNVATCWLSSGGTQFVTGCATGSYLSLAGTCVTGSLTDTKCWIGSSNGCAWCQAGYFLSGAANCTACPGNCTGCTSGSNCTGCSGTVNLTNGSCSTGKGSIVFSGLAFLSAVLYYFL